MRNSLSRDIKLVSDGYYMRILDVMENLFAGVGLPSPRASEANITNRELLGRLLRNSPQLVRDSWLSGVGVIAGIPEFSARNYRKLPEYIHRVRQCLSNFLDETV